MNRLLDAAYAKYQMIVAILLGRPVMSKMICELKDGRVYIYASTDSGGVIFGNTIIGGSMWYDFNQKRCGFLFWEDPELRPK